MGAGPRRLRPHLWGTQAGGGSVTNGAVRAVVPAGLAALVLALPAAAADWSPSAGWLAEARCVHVQEGSRSANTGNG